MTKAERWAKIAALGCIVCINNDVPGTPCEIHHLRVATGAAQRAHWSRTIGLCPCHHRQGDGSERFEGQYGYHVAPRTWALKYGAQEDLLIQTNTLIGADE